MFEAKSRGKTLSTKVTRLRAHTFLPLGGTGRCEHFRLIVSKFYMHKNTVKTYSYWEYSCPGIIETEMMFCT